MICAGNVDGRRYLSTKGTKIFVFFYMQPRNAQTVIRKLLRWIDDFKAFKISSVKTTVSCDKLISTFYGMTTDDKVADNMNSAW